MDPKTLKIDRSVPTGTLRSVALDLAEMTHGHTDDGVSNLLQCHSVEPAQLADLLANLRLRRRGEVKPVAIPRPPQVMIFPPCYVFIRRFDGS